jgi:photosystem II stability/assembly factor-like uncharacterized protein
MDIQSNPNKQNNPFQDVRKTFMLLLLLAFAVTGNGQWRQTDGPVTQKTVYDIISKENTLFSSASCGTFFSEDEGNSWRPVHSETFYTSAIFNDTLYVGGVNVRKIFRKNNTWTDQYVLYRKEKVFDLFADAGGIYAGFSKYGFNYSPDGRNWKSFNEGLPKDTNTNYPSGTYYTYNVFAAGGNSQYLFIGTKSGIYRSQKSLLSWMLLPSGGKKKVNAIFCRDTTLLMASENILYRSNDNGTTWLVSKAFKTSTIINRISCLGDTLFAFTSAEGIYISTNRGKTWIPDNFGLTTQAPSGIARHRNKLYLASSEGIYKDFPNGYRADHYMVCSSVIDLEQNDSCLAAVDFYNVYISRNNGETWVNSTSEIPKNILWSVVNVKNSFVFSGTGPGKFPQTTVSYYSDNGGITWEKGRDLPHNGDPYKLRSNGIKVMAVQDGLILTSNDKGQSWDEIILPKGVSDYWFYDALLLGNEIILDTWSPLKLIKSTDFGLNWTTLNEDLPGEEIKKLGEYEGILFAEVNGRLYRLEKNEPKWKYSGYGLPVDHSSLSLNIGDFAGNDRFLFVCTLNKVFASENKGLSWADISKGLPPLPAGIWGGSLLIKDSLLFFGTNNFGVWKLNISGLQIPSIPAEPVETAIVYPNPTKEGIYFKLPENQAAINVDIYNSAGIFVQSVYAPGNYFSIKNLPSGLYLFVITSELRNRYTSRVVKLN